MAMIKHRIRQIESLLHHHDHQARQPPRPRPLQTVQDVIDLLQEQIEAIRAEPWSTAIEKARAIGYLAGVARKAMETGTLAARIEMLELVLQPRSRGSR
jgi:hypothetical protein